MGLSSQEVQLFLPRFELKWRFSLKSALSALGMEEAFSPTADFSGVDGKHELKLSEILHQAYLKVNEEGTEAAAATSAILAPKSLAPVAEPPVFRADHPFVFLIRENSTRSILFLGRVSNPANRAV